MEMSIGRSLYLSIAFILWSPLLTESQTYTILTPENSFCPSNNTCFTLTENATTTYSDHEFISLKLLPGNHTLDDKMVINNVQKFYLYAMESDTNSTKAAVINCSPSARMIFTSCDHVDISNIQFHGCVGNVIDSVGNFTIKFSSFVGIDWFESALTFNGIRYLKIAHSQFSLITDISSHNPKNQVGVINAILCKTVEIVNSSFLNNTHVMLIFAQHVSNISIKHSHFMDNSINSIIVAESNSSVSVYNSTFANNSFFGFAFAMHIKDSLLKIHTTELDYSGCVGAGGAIYAVESVVEINASTFKKFIGSHNGGVIVCFGGHISVYATTFEHNAALREGGVLYTDSTDIKIEKSLFRFNSALIGGVLSLHWGTVTINGSEFSNNGANNMTVGARGGAVVIERANVIFSNSKFKNNSAESVGAIECYRSIILLSSLGFYSNKAKYKGVLYIYKTWKFSVSNIEFEYNVGNSGVIYLADSDNIVFTFLSYKFNTGSIMVLGTRLSFFKECVFYRNNMPEHIKQVSKFHNQGGAITSFQSSLVFNLHSDFNFTDNLGIFGGAIYAVKSTLDFFSNVLLSGNRALQDGGGIYTYQTVIQSFCNLTFIQNIANNSGGRIYIASDSLSILPDDSRSCTSMRISMVENFASYGGAIFFSNDAKFYAFREKPLGVASKILELRNNRADYGGALYVADDTNTGMCHSLSGDYFSTTPNSECFLQNLVLDRHTVSSNKSALNKEKFIQFHNNTAKNAGNNLFGGLLDRCTLNPYYINPLLQLKDSYFEHLSQVGIDLDSVSSHPVKICLCVDNQPDCSYESTSVYVKKGELFNISVVAVDQVNHTVNATVHCKLSSPEAGFGEGQMSQASFETCTFLYFQLSSPLGTENLTLYADGPCKDARLSRLSIPVIFLPCTCPIGFQPLKSKETLCVCECDSRLQHLGIFCNVSSHSLVRETSYWIDHVNMSENISGFIYYPHCPYDYCLPPSVKLSINLKLPNGANAQCMFNRTGVLCGYCTQGLTLSLGSSRCLICPSTWPVSMIFALLGLALAGFLLVALILILNLTVAAGTINGFIFYANIIGANSRTYLPFGSPNFCTIFIAWFNLEFGFDLCFFEGMDAYAKTWLQLSFPVYLFGIIGAIMFISDFSSKFSRLTCKKNQIATLATLVLLAFAKFLHTTIAIFSFAVLNYPNDTNNVLWLLDASVKYLKGKHLPLFIIALLIVVAEFFFILLLLFWQLIVYGSNLKMLKWSKNVRIHYFIDSYLAPFTPKFHFWTGLLLLVRVIIYLVSNRNVSHDPVIDLIAVGIVMLCLILLKVLLRKKIYQKLSTDLLETACYFNILLFTIISFFALKSPWLQRIFAQISVSIIFVQLFFVFLCHLFYTLRPVDSFNHLILFIIAKLKRTHENPDNICESQDVRPNLLSTSFIHMDSCLLCTDNETRAKEDQIHLKGSGQINSPESLDSLDSMREPLLKTAV